MSVAVDGNKKIEVTGEPVRLVCETVQVDRVDIRAAAGNTGDVYVGSRTVKSSTSDLRGHRLQANDVLTLDGPTNLRDWWFVGANVGDYVYWGAERNG